MSYNKISIFILFTFLFFMMFSCKTQDKIENQNLAFIYEADKQKINPQFTAFHKNDSISFLIMSIAAEDLLYQRKKGEENFNAKIKVSYKTYLDTDRKTLIDSSSFYTINEVAEVVEKEILAQHEILAPKGGKYFLDITTIDINANETWKSFITIDKSNINSKNNFLIKNIETGNPNVKKFFKVNDDISVSSNIRSANSFFVKFYAREIPLPLPPFVVGNMYFMDYEPDMVFVINKNVEFNDAYLKFDQPGIYHIQIDTARNKDGLTLYCRNDNFPYLKTVNELIEPLRFITGKKEFNDIKMAENQKKALDAFWLKNAGSPERAKRVIKAFYNRVQHSNNYFTSYTEGWKTDKGMVYLIYGTPTSVYMDKNEEYWVYGEENSVNALTFIFTRKAHPFSDNVFILDRSISYKGSWYRAVEAWRHGRIF